MNDFARRWQAVGMLIRDVDAEIDREDALAEEIRKRRAQIRWDKSVDDLVAQWQRDAQHPPRSAEAEQRRRRLALLRQR